MYNKAAIYKYRRNKPYFWKGGSQASRKNADIRFLLKRRGIIDAMKNRPCADCAGWFNPWQMDFDHTDADTKLGNVSQIKSIKRLIEESKKCDLVCANCHRDRTQKRFVAAGGLYVQR